MKIIYMTTLIAVAIRNCFRNSWIKWRFAEHDICFIHNFWRLWRGGCDEAKFFILAHSSRYSDRWQSSLHYMSKLLPTNWLFQLFLQLGRFTRHARVTFLVPAKTTVINAESSNTFFYIVLSQCKHFFFFSLTAWGLKKIITECWTSEKTEVDLRLTKFKKLRQLKAHRFSLNIYY